MSLSAKLRNPVSEETKAKISQSNKGRKLNEKQRLYLKSNNPMSKKVMCLNDNKIFNSILLAGQYYKIAPENISKICSGKYYKKEIKGLSFKFVVSLDRA